MSTDDEEATSQKQTMQTELENITAESKRVFEDVEEEFEQLHRVMRRFEGWKAIDKPSYADAYVTFNLPKIFAPFISLQLVLWNPLSREEEGMEIVEIEKMKWFNQLLLYGFHDADVSMGSFKEDPDRKLMSYIVERVILPKVKDLVSCFWDPLSHVQSVRLVNLLRHYTIAYPSISPSSKQLKELVVAIIAKIRDAIENDVFIPMFPKSVYESKTSGVSLFFQRQFWSSWKLLGSVLMWHRILSDSVIHDLAIRSLLNLYLLPALNLAAEINICDSLEKTRHVINVLPREWSKNEGGTHAFLGRLEAFLVALAVKLDPTANVVELKEICELLKAIGARAQSEIVASKYL
ncbi:UNVERIFIED_CONTAM: hypothetical protein GTU68_035862 [Idotea baltica]|nr:hypothetical protein [Idotea baltica]